MNASGSGEPHSGLATSSGIDGGRLDLIASVAWPVVIIPLVWGVWVTLTKAIVLFHLPA